LGTDNSRQTDQAPDLREGRVTNKLFVRLTVIPTNTSNVANPNLCCARNTKVEVLEILYSRETNPDVCCTNQGTTESKSVLTSHTYSLKVRSIMMGKLCFFLAGVTTGAVIIYYW
jgi:hypothetical protein